jgi:peptidoglycan hydrolase CwlO-like protein
MSLTQAHNPRAKNFGALLNASSELEQLRQENELLKIQIEQLKRQIEQLNESTKKPNNRIDTLEEIIEERDEDIDTLKKEIDLSAPLSVIASYHYDFRPEHRHSSSPF